MTNTRKVFLASSSPRRRSLLEAAGFVVVSQAPDANETWPTNEPTPQAVITLARRKLAKIQTVPTLGQPMLAADTVVFFDGQVFGKPQNAQAAKEVLRHLSGKTHQVITGFVMQHADFEHAQAVVTKVHFRSLSEDDIVRYVDAGESLDKAGGYGIQSLLGGSLIDWVEGSYTNVMGLPVAEVVAAWHAALALKPPTCNL